MFSLFPVDLVGHDVVEVIGCHEAIFVQVGFAEDVDQFLLSQIFAQLLGHLL